MNAFKIINYLALLFLRFYLPCAFLTFVFRQLSNLRFNFLALLKPVLIVKGSIWRHDTDCLSYKLFLHHSSPKVDYLKNTFNEYLSILFFFRITCINEYMHKLKKPHLIKTLPSALLFQIYANLYFFAVNVL